MNKTKSSVILGLATEPKKILHAPEVVTQKGVKGAIYFKRPIRLQPKHTLMCMPWSILKEAEAVRPQTHSVPGSRLSLDINELKVKKVRAMAMLLAPYNRLVDNALQRNQFLGAEEVTQKIHQIESTSKRYPEHQYDFAGPALIRLLAASEKGARDLVYDAFQNSPYTRFDLRQIAHRHRAILKVFGLRASMGYRAEQTTSRFLGETHVDHFCVWQHPTKNITAVTQKIQNKLLHKSVVCSKLALEQKDSALGELAQEFASMAIDAGGANRKALQAKAIGILLGGVPEHFMALEEFAIRDEVFGSPQRFEKAILDYVTKLKESINQQWATSLLAKHCPTKIVSCALKQPSAMTVPAF